MPKGDITSDTYIVFIMHLGVANIDNSVASFCCCFIELSQFQTEDMRKLESKAVHIVETY